MIRRVLILTTAVALLGVLALTAPTQVSAQAVSAFWNAQYYNNATLSGSATVTRGESNIAFSWGLGSPDPAIPVDGFSARFATDVGLQAGTYRFFLLADDNARITFNFGLTPVIDTFAQTNQVGQLVSATVDVPAAGSYHIQIDYREVTSDAFLYMSFGPAATFTQPNFAAPPVNVPVAPSGSWVAQYYPNTSLSGDPVGILSVISPTNNWGTNAPLGTMPADNFSVRWTGNFTLPTGTYQIAVSVDDGVRVFVNGVLLINQFGGATGQTYTANFTSTGGNSTIVVEYVEFGGNAFIDYRLTQQFQQQPQQQQPQPSGNATVTIAAFRLNVREAPTTSAAILRRVNQNETYPVIGRNASSTWYQINAGGTIGWVGGGYVVISNGANIPVTDGTRGPTVNPTPQPPINSPFGIVATATPFSVNMRQGPGTSFARVGRLPAGSSAAVIGRSADNQWWQITFNGINGWVSATFARLNTGADVNRLPITG
jgi:uncharacterized protein YraI